MTESLIVIWEAGKYCDQRSGPFVIVGMDVILCSLMKRNIAVLS